jgi:hypothetical protein
MPTLLDAAALDVELAALDGVLVLAAVGVVVEIVMVCP